MAIYKNTFEGGSNGAAISPSGSGGASGTAFGVVVANGATLTGSNSSPDIIYSSAAALSGSLGCRMTLAATQSYLLMNASSSMTNRVYVRLKVRYPGPGVGTAAINPFTTLLSDAASGGRPAAIAVSTDGRPFLSVSGSGIWFTGGANPDSRPSTALTPGSVYTFIMVVGKASVDGATDGELGFRILDSNDNVVHSWTGTGNTGVANFVGVRFGGANTAYGWTSVDMDDVELGDVASGWLPGSGEATVVVTSDSYLVADFTGSTSGAGNTLSFSIAFTSGQDNSSGIQQPMAGLFLIPRGTTDSVYTVTINDGGTLTTQIVNVPAEGAGVIDGIIEYIWDGTDWS